MNDRKIRLQKLTVPSGLSEEFWQKALNKSFVYSIIGLICGLILAVFGLVLFLNGITSETSNLFMKVLGLNTGLEDFPAGMGFLVMGIVLIFVTRFNIQAMR